MNNQNLGINTIIQNDNAGTLFTNQLLSSSEFQPLVETESTYVFTKQGDDEILNITKKYNNDVPETKEERQVSNPSTYITNDYIHNFYFASLTVVGLYIVFRMIKKTR